MTRRRRGGRRTATHPYTPSALLPADHNGLKPCVCGRAKTNQAHDQDVPPEVTAAQAEHLRRIGDEL
ncbi:hypothetical protein [Micromonospora endolithica]|uniref:Uncharacterized protein n=1 Tax=Micromonospora endolithica TaxID=230091 RepID=A0A3A9YR63_9ACTN|nr:hypothetical protein [Micromonospora endolithica]RKN38473.1 hypothetical protein D7223_31205 [Micromonospora endolithica]TWJ23104.1 hypothetical protein JD76_03233 [Micromonospora endolithica]